METPEDIMKKAGRRVRADREAAGLTQEKLAEISGYTEVFISDMETGRRKRINLIPYMDMASIFGHDWRTYFSKEPENDEIRP